MAGLLDSIFGGGGGGADDPYADILTPAQRNHMQAQGLLAMAGAFAQAGMPSRLPVPFGSALGAAAAALGTGQEAGMKTAIENALAAQKVRDLRNTAEFRKKFFGDQDALGKAIEQILRPTGTAATPGAPSSGGGTPPAGTYAGTGVATEVGGGGLLSSPDLLLGSEKNPDYISQGLAPKGSGGGLLDYPADQGTMRAGGGLVPDAPNAGIGTRTPSSRYAPGGDLYPFKDLGVVPGMGGAGAPSNAPPARISAADAARMNAADSAPGGHLPVMSSDYIFGKGKPIPPGAGSVGGAPTPVPGVTSVPGGTNGIDPRKRAALEAILGGMQTAQAGPSAGRLPQFAGPGAADAPAADTVPEGGGLLGVAPDLRAPIEANPFARQASPGDPRGVAPLIRQAALRYGVDPDVALKVARSEGLGTFLGDQGRSGSAFQLYTGGGLGNEFQKQERLDPLDPANEPAAIDWALRNVNRTGWSPYHGAANVGVGPRTGLPGGDLPPPDQVIPSGPGAGGGLPPVVRAQYAAPGGGGAAMPAAPGAAPPAAGMPGGPPQYPSAPPAGNQAAVSTLLLELARRNAAAEVLGMGNPYGSLLTVLQGSPQYKAQVEAATEEARRRVGLGYKKEESRLEAEGKLPSEMARDVNKGVIDELNKKIEQMGAAALNPAGTLQVRDATTGQIVERQANQLQKVIAQAGFDVPELGIKGMYGPAPAGQIPGLPSMPGAAGAAGTPRPQAQQGFTPGGPGTLADTPYNSPSDLKLQESDIKLLDQKRALADTARTTIQNANDLRATIEQGVIAGAGADTRTQMLKLGQLLGITGTDTNQLIANTEKYIASQGKNLKEGLAGLGPPISNQDVAIADRIAGGQMTTPQGMLEILRIREKYHRQAIVDYNQMASRVPVSPIIGDRTVKEPPTYGARIAQGKNGERVWEKPNGEWVPF